jgi:hypothetical protein
VATSETSEKERTVIAAWVPASLAAQVKQEADRGQRSVSRTIRLLLEARFDRDQEKRP